jgi:hypothetical protein
VSGIEDQSASRDWSVFHTREIIHEHGSSNSGSVS